MNRNEKIHHLKIALALQGIAVSEKTADTIIETIDSIVELGGNFSIDDAAEIEFLMDEKYKEKEDKE